MIKIGLQKNKYKGILRPFFEYFSGSKFKLIKKPIFWIFLLALFLRIFKLGEYPVGLHVDEVKVGWNALSILKTGLDDHGNFLNLYYDSFGDYRPTGIFYTTIPFILILGKTTFAVRFSSALFGALTVIPVFLLTNAISQKKNKLTGLLSTGEIAAVIFAFSPWHIEVSRATSEPAISILFAVFALYHFIDFLYSKKPKSVFLSLTFITLSYLMYHSIRLLAPLFYLATFLTFKKGVYNKRSKKLLYFSILFVFILTTFFSINRNGVSRLSQVSVLKDVDVVYEVERIKSENPNPNLISKISESETIIYIKNFTINYLDYFSGRFLLGSYARPYRYATPGSGLITFAELIFLIFGVIQIIKGNKTFWPLILILISPLPAAITSEDAPNLHRSIFMIPFIAIVCSYGVEYLLDLNKKYKFKLIYFLPFLFLNYVIFFNLYFNHSVSHKPFIKNFFVDSPTYRNVGVIELVSNLPRLSQKYDKIVITNFPDSPFPWYAFFTNQDPRQINKTYSNKTNERVYNNIIFSEDKCPSDYAFDKYKEVNILVVNAWECPHEKQIESGLGAKVVNKIFRPDATVVYVFLERNGLPKPI